MSNCRLHPVSCFCFSPVKLLVEQLMLQIVNAANTAPKLIQKMHQLRSRTCLSVKSDMAAVIIPPPNYPAVFPPIVPR